MTARDHWLDDLHPEAYRTLVEGVPAVLYIDRPDEGRERPALAQSGSGTMWLPRARPS